jgi:hypothetical protein
MIETQGIGGYLKARARTAPTTATPPIIANA